MHLDEGTNIGVVGAGTMGSGIAVLAAVRGHPVALYDADPSALHRSRAYASEYLERRVGKGRMTREQAESALERLRFAEGAGETPWNDLAGCGLVIEAVVEDLEVKREVFSQVEEVVSDDAVLATNTSSLSVAALGAGRRNAGRLVGVHFFNPAPVMPLVEIVGAITTDPEVTETVRALMDAWGKTPVLASDTPGFIVNRIARPFYGEALRLAEEGIADFATVDWAMREIGGFKMGPFELMDFIGNDVNYTVTCSVFEATYYDSRYRPSVVQRRMVEAGLLGRKAGRGFFAYPDGGSGPQPDRDPALGRRIVERIVVMLINEAVDALHLRIATAADIELAMTAGVNYPKGLLAWGEEMGWATVLQRMNALREEYAEDRYRPSPLLRRLARDGGSTLAREPLS